MKKLLMIALLIVASLAVQATTYIPMTIEFALSKGYIDEVMTQKLIESLIGPQKCFSHPRIVDGVYVVIYGSLSSDGELPQCVRVVRTIKSAPTYTYSLYIEK